MQLEEEAKAKEAKPTPPPSVPSDIEVSIQSKLMIEKARIEKDREEMRIKSEEARKAAARRERIKKETERLRKESEIARQKAIEEGMKQLHEQEIAERHAKIEAERQKRLEDERKAIEKIRLRKLEDEERENRAKEEAAQQSLFFGLRVPASGGFHFITNDGGRDKGRFVASLPEKGPERLLKAPGILNKSTTAI